MSNYIDDLAESIYQAAPHDGPIEPDDYPLYRIYAVLGYVKGEDVTLKDVHDAWSAWRVATVPDHRSLKPFAELSPEVQALDQPYVDAIRRVMASRVFA